MEAALFAKMFVDPDLNDLQKLRAKYADASWPEFLQILYGTIYSPLPLHDEFGRALRYSEYLRMPIEMIRLLMTPQRNGERYGARAVEEEIGALLTLEGVEFDRKQVRMMVCGMPATSALDKRMKALKETIELIGEPQEQITKKMIYKIYQMAVQPFAAEEDRLRPKRYYRHEDRMGADKKRQGVSYKKLPQYMDELVTFMNAADGMDDLAKAAAVHYDMLYLRPYFTGNETMAKLVASLYLVQRGYPSVLFLSFAKSIVRSRAAYEQTRASIRRNQERSGVLDITPFLAYYADHVYGEAKMPVMVPKDTLEAFQKAQNEGLITVRQKEVWEFILLAYGRGEFTNQKICSDFGHISYSAATKYLTAFVDLGLVERIRYGTQNRYRVK